MKQPTPQPARRIAVCLLVVLAIGAAPAAAQPVADTSFAGGLVTRSFGVPNLIFHRVIVQPDGKVLTAGWISTLEQYNFEVLRYNANGTPDTGFGVGGRVSIDFFGHDDSAADVALQPDGKIVVVGGAAESGDVIANGFALVRLTSSGQLDSSFGIGGKVVHRQATAPSGSSIAPCIPLARARAVAIQADGRIVVAGDAYEDLPGTSSDKYLPAVARFVTDGSLDSTIQPATSPAGSCPGAGNIRVLSGAGAGFQTVKSLRLRSDGRLIVGGGGEFNSTTHFLALLEADGQPLIFKALTGQTIFLDLALQPDDRVVMASSSGLQRFLADLELDPTFGSGGTVCCFPGDVPTGVSLAPDGRIVLITNTTLKRYTASGSLVDSIPLPIYGRRSTVQPDGRIIVLGIQIVFGSPFDPEDWRVAIMRFTATPANLVQNGNFAGQTTGWIAYGAPDLSVLQHNSASNGVFEFFRQAPPPGESNQATIFQETGVPLAAHVPLLAEFDLGNSSSVRKRVSVLILAHDFSDLSVCTFWLPANAPTRTYRMRTHTSRVWSNAAIYFYAASTGENGGRYQLDNVSLLVDGSGSATRTECVDPLTPLAPGGATGANLIANGGFAAPFGFPWFTHGNLTSQVADGVFQFYRVAPTDPAGVVAQTITAPIDAGEILTATFQLGNASSIRQRVTVILGSEDFTDLAACTFWLPAGQPLQPYLLRSFATISHPIHLLSIYSATVANNPWMLLDDVTLRRTPGIQTLGTECIEPADGGSVLAGMPAISSGPSVKPPGAEHTRAQAPGAVRVLEWPDGIDVSLFGDGAWRFQFDLSGEWIAELQVRVDDGPWIAVGTGRTIDDWLEIDADFTPLAGRSVHFRLVLRWPATSERR